MSSFEAFGIGCSWRQDNRLDGPLVCSTLAAPIVLHKNAEFGEKVNEENSLGKSIFFYIAHILGVGGLSFHDHISAPDMEILKRKGFFYERNMTFHINFK